MGWTGESWLLSTFMEKSITHSVAGVLFILATIVFIISGIGILANAEWRNPLLLATAILSSIILLLFWDASFAVLVQKGLSGLLIIVGILLVITLF